MSQVVFRRARGVNQRNPGNDIGVKVSVDVSRGAAQALTAGRIDDSKGEATLCDEESVDCPVIEHGLADSTVTPVRKVIHPCDGQTLRAIKVRGTFRACDVVPWSGIKIREESCAFVSV